MAKHPGGHKPKPKKVGVKSKATTSVKKTGVKSK